MRITKPLIGTAAGAAVLGASLALGLSVASASTSSAAASTAGHSSSAATSAKPAATPSQKAPTAPVAIPGRKCTHMSGSARSPASVPAAN